MSDHNTSTVAEMDEGESRQARLDRVINSLGSRMNAANPTPLSVDASTRTRPNVRYDSARDVFIYQDTGEVVPASVLEQREAANPSEERVYDNGISIEFAVEQLQTEWKRLKGALDEAAFDPRTGAKVYRLQGAERNAWELRLKQFSANAEDQLRTYAKLKRQREEDRAAAEQAALDEASLEETIRREAQKRAFELEVEQRAQKIMAEKNRRESGRSM